MLHKGCVISSSRQWDIHWKSNRGMNDKNDKIFLLFSLPKAKKLLQEMSEILLPVFSGIFMVLNLTSKSLICFEFILVHSVRGWSSFFFFFTHICSSNTIYWVDYLYPIVCFCLLCQILSDHIDVGLFLDSLLFYWSISLFVCQYHAVLITTAL